MVKNLRPDPGNAHSMTSLLRKIKLTPLVSAVLTCWVHLCPGQYEQSLEYHVHRDSQYKFSELGYAHLTIVESRPGGVNMPDFQCADPLFAQWKTPLAEQSFLWVALDRQAGDNNYTLLYMDTNRDGQLRDESAVTSHRSTGRFALFGPVELLLEGDDGPVTYHLNLQYNHYADRQAFFAWSACWYEGGLQVGQKQRQCQLLDRNANGTFNDKADASSRADLIQLGNSDPRMVGQFLQVDNDLFQLEIGRHGAWVELTPFELVFSGQVRVPEFISEMKVIGFNGEFVVRPQAGLVTLPEGQYTLSYWTIDRQDENGHWWQMRGEEIYWTQASFEVAEGPPRELKIGEPLFWEFEVHPRADSHVQFFYKTSGPISKSVFIKRKYHPISVPHMKVRNRDGSYKQSLPLTLGPIRNWRARWEEPDRERRPYIFDVEIEGPFAVHSQAYYLKAEQRDPPICGDQVVPVRASAEVQGRVLPLSGVTAGSGLRHADNDRLLEHDMRPESMWQAPRGGRPTKLQFDFDRTVNLDLIQVWNYNRRFETHHGLAGMDIQIGIEGETWETVRRSVTLEPGEGSDDYDVPALIRLDGTPARKIRFTNLKGFPGGQRLGLSEVAFFTERTQQACNPLPKDKTWIAPGQSSLFWTSGIGARTQRLYVGDRKTTLSYLGLIQGRDYTKVTLQGLLPKTQYWWRVDEVLTQGRIVTGPVWSFRTGGLTGWWPLDETQGRQAEDRSGFALPARLRGNPSWRPAGGRLGGALELDGDGDTVECVYGAESPHYIDRFTVSTWIKVKTFKKDYQTIIMHGERAWMLQGTRKRRNLRIVLNGIEGHINTEFRAVGHTSVNDGKWHHVAGTYDGSCLCLYVDGKREVLRLVSGRIPVGSSRIIIGNNGGRWDPCLKGLIDDLRLYDYALTQDQIRALADGKEPLPATASGSLPVIVTPASNQK